MVDKNLFDTELDPEIVKVRDQIINKIGDKPLEEVNQIIKKLLSEQMDEVTRLGALAARVKIIRSKIELLYDKKVDLKGPSKKKEIKSSDTDLDSKVVSKKEDTWIRIKMLEAGDINGKQIDKGVVLDVKEEDGNKLVEAKKAEIVEEKAEGAAPIEKKEKKDTPTETKEEEKVEAKDEGKKDTPAETKEASEKELLRIHEEKEKQKKLEEEKEKNGSS